MNTFSKQSRLRRLATAILIATLAIRALVPVGYMPGNLIAGEFAELCPVASAATFELLGTQAGHEHHHGSTDAEAVSLGTACPIGSSLFFDALPTLAVITDAQAIVHVYQDALRPQTVVSIAFPNRHARAPPLS